MLVLFLKIERPEPPKKLGFTDKLKNDVGFSAEQMSVYVQRRDKFWASVRQQFDSIKETKINFYHLMYDPSVPDSVLEWRADSIGKQQQKLDLFVVRHFKDIRKICTHEQLPKYDSLLPALIDRMTARPERK
jgi:periplasmic protein CpxP/Spy